MNTSKIKQTNRIKRILYIQKPRGGGSTISLYELVKGIDTTKYEPIILFLLQNKYIENFDNIGIKTITLDISKYDKNKQKRKRYLIGKLQLIIVDLLVALKIFFLIKKEKIDLVHQNLGFDRKVMIAAISARVPQVCHFRKFDRVLPLTIKWLKSSVDAALYTTQAISDYYTNLGAKVPRSDIVYEPIDIQRFSEKKNINSIKQQFSINDQDFVISNIARITPWKGQYYFLKAMEDFIKQYKNIKILIVGEPGQNERDREYLNLLKTMAQKGPLNGHVMFTGVRHDIPEIMAASNVIVHSASEPEPFGLVIAEAMATGIPVIATKGGGPMEIIKDGITGLLVPMRSSNAIKEAIQRLFISKSLRETISKNARKEVKERFQISQHVNKVQKIYEEIFNDI